MSDLVCAHGQLSRQCEMCELTAENEHLRFKINKFENEARWARILLNVDRNGANGCWTWLGNVSKYGYGITRTSEATSAAAHRVVFEGYRRRKIPEKLTLDHLCLNKLCVNPDHLEICSRGENARRHMLSRSHCKWGHEYNVNNTSYDKQGLRRCKACALARYHKARDALAENEVGRE